MTLRVAVNDLMDRLGVGYVPGPYETSPWSHYDADKGITCSAEVRMGSSSDEVEAEIQVMYDEPPAGKPPMEQVCYMRCAPAGDGKWTVSALRLKGEAYGEGVYNWEEKACVFFRSVVLAILSGRMPDIDELIDEAFFSERGGDQTGGGGKSPKIRPSQLLDMKKGGRGF
jgi:hypothetical protein